MFSRIFKIINHAPIKNNLFNQKLFQQQIKFNFSSINYEKTIIELIKKHPKCSGKEVTLSSSFEKLGLDSLERVELIAEFEEQFNVNIENEVTEKIKTISNAVKAFSEQKKN